MATSAIRRDDYLVKSASRNQATTNLGNITYAVIGHVVILQVAGIRLTQTDATTVIASGLPAPTSDLNFSIMDVAGTIRVGVFTSGDLKIWWGNTSISTTAEYSGTFMYYTTANG